MGNTISINKIYLNQDEFTIDDIFAAAMVKLYNPNVYIERNNNVHNISKNELLLNSNNSFYKRTKDKFNKPLSFSMIVWNLLGEKLINKTHAHDKKGAMLLFEQKVLKDISYNIYNDFYYLKRSKIFKLIYDMNLYYNELESNSYDEQFNEAIDFTMLYLENIFREIIQETDYRKLEDEIWKDAEQNQVDGIYILKERIPWQVQIKSNPESNAKIIIQKSNRGGYSITTRDVNQFKIKESKYLSFIHPSKFMGTSATLNDAIMAAKYTMENEKCFA